MVGSDELTYSEIKSWAELVEVDITPWETRLIKSLDRLFWRVRYD